MTDRTDEFRGAVKVFRPTVLPQKIDNAGTRGVAPHHFDQQQQQPPQQLAFFDEDGDGKDEAGALPRYAKPEASDFLQMAASVAVGFEGTAKLIERLKKLVGRKGFSNNPAAEISDVMKLFEGDMAGLQKDIAALQRYANGEVRGGPPRNSQRQVHCQHIVDALKHSFQEHTKAFRDALLLRAAVEKQQSERQRKFSHSRGVAPVKQLDYPLFGNSNNGDSQNGPRARAAARRRPSPPSRPPPPPPQPPARAPHVAEPGALANAGSSYGSAYPYPPAVTPGLGEVSGAGSGKLDSWGGSNQRDPVAGAPWPGASSGRGSGSGGGNGASSMYGGAGSANSSPFGMNGPSGVTVGGYGGRGAGERAGLHDASSSRYGGVGGEPGGRGVTLPPTEPFRQRPSGLRKRGGGGDGEEEARRAAWQVQVQEESKNRVEESHKVEKMISELGQMFTQFSTMVAAQEEVVLHIEDDVEAAHAFAEEGQAHLAKYYQVMSGNRGIIIKVFALLIFFIWVFVGLMR